MPPSAQMALSQRGSEKQISPTNPKSYSASFFLRARKHKVAFLSEEFQGARQRAASAVYDGDLVSVLGELHDRSRAFL